MATQGTIFLKPGEQGLAEGLARRTGATIVVPATGAVYDPKSGRFVGGGAAVTDPSQLVGFRPSRAFQLAQIERAKARDRLAKEQAESERKRLQELERLQAEKRFLSQRQATELSRLRRLSQRKGIEELKVN